MLEQVNVEMVRAVAFCLALVSTGTAILCGAGVAMIRLVAADTPYGESPQSICRSGKVPCQRAERSFCHAASCSVLEASAEASAQQD